MNHPSYLKLLTKLDCKQKLVDSGIYYQENAHSTTKRFHSKDIANCMYITHHKQLLSYQNSSHFEDVLHLSLH